MRTIHVHRFDGGIAEDVYAPAPGEFSISKQFDILTYPGRLSPLRGMTSDTSGTGIGNIIVATNGNLYGVGTNAGNGRLYVRADNNTTASSTGSYSASSTWRNLTTDQLSGKPPFYDFLVDYKDVGNVRSLFWASTNLIVTSDPVGGSSTATHALTFTTIGQGLVHPKDKILYFPYQTSSGSFINSNNAGSYAASDIAFTLSSRYRAYCLSYFGNQLAIPLTLSDGTYGFSSGTDNIVALWNRDTSTTTFDDTIPWGTGALQVLNNVGGILIGISTSSANYTGSVQDFDSIVIRAYAGGAEPTVIKEIKAQHLTGTSRPICTINPRVNFVARNRLYFSVNINPNDGTSPAYYGLWSVGKNKTTGQYTVTMERVATNDNSETGVIAAAMSGDFVSMVHTTEGTLTYSINGNTSSSTHAATSVYESAINPEMPTNDRYLKKKLVSVALHTAPLTSGAQAVLKCRVDSNPTGSWTTLVTKTTTSPDTSLVVAEMPMQAASAIAEGRNFEFRVESTGGAQITGFSYKYDVNETHL